MFCAHTPLSSMIICAFGHDAFGQTVPRLDDDFVPGSQAVVPGVADILYCAWESTFGVDGELYIKNYIASHSYILNTSVYHHVFISSLPFSTPRDARLAAGKLVVWGFDPQTASQSNGVVPLTWFEPRKAAKVYGDPNSTMGILDVDGNVLHCQAGAEPVLVATECKDVCCITGTRTVLFIK